MAEDRVPRIMRISWLVGPIMAVLWVGIMWMQPNYGQDSPDEHQKHHPDQTQTDGTSEQGTASAQGDVGGGMMGGGMDKMMEKMGAPKPKELYPRLMGLPDLPLEERAEIEREARQRMVSGTALLSEGLKTLSRASAGDDFGAMQNATVTIREGLAQFESGLAAHRAIVEGKAPRNVALTWFRSQMNLLPPPRANSGLRVFGMTVFHTSIMAGLLIFAAAMIWMYFLKMRRASALLEKLTVAGPPIVVAGSDPSGPQAPTPAPGARPPTPPPSREPGSSVVDADHRSDERADVCKDTCSAEDVSARRPDISQGLLPVVKRRLCKLRVARIDRETADVKTFRLVACHGGPIPFSYLPGQFLTLTLPTGDKAIRRSYTISSSPTQGYYCEITVKREERGEGSRYLHDAVKEGSTLEVQAPSGRFIFTGKDADSVVLIAGGVGITPMMSITRALTDMCWQGEIYFIVACREPGNFIFESELRKLQERHANLHLFAAMSRIKQDVSGYKSGRLSKERLTEWVPAIASKRIHICGAPPMMDATRQMLAELGVPPDMIHTENFGSLQKPRIRRAAQEQASATVEPQTAATVSFRTSGCSAQCLPDETILEAGERVGVSIDNSCRVGMCGLCKVKLLSGRASMAVEDGLDPDDKAEGMILACQARATGDVAVEA